VRPPRMLLWKKTWNSKWRPRNGCDSGLKAKNLITTIQVNLAPKRSETWRKQHKFTWIVVIKFFAFSPLSQPFLGCHFGFHIFFQTAFLGAAHFFYSWAVFELDKYTCTGFPHAYWTAPYAYGTPYGADANFTHNTAHMGT